MKDFLDMSSGLKSDEFVFLIVFLPNAHIPET